MFCLRFTPCRAAFRGLTKWPGAVERDAVSEILKIDYPLPQDIVTVHLTEARTRSLWTSSSSVTDWRLRDERRPLPPQAIGFQSREDHLRSRHGLVRNRHRNRGVRRSPRRSRFTEADHYNPGTNDDNDRHRALSVIETTTTVEVPRPPAKNRPLSAVRAQKISATEATTAGDTRSTARTVELSYQP